LFEIDNLTIFINANKQIVVRAPYSENLKTNKISVYNINSIKIIEQLISGTETVIDTRLYPGAYLVQLSQDDSVKTAKILVN
jgi:glycyl-tRNA synthetase beta subunit